MIKQTLLQYISNYSKLVVHKLSDLVRLFYHATRHFFLDDCLYKASALTFTTILSIVPLITVIFSVFSAFPKAKVFAGAIQDYILEVFTAGKSKEIAVYLQEFVSHVYDLSLIGLVFLLVTAVMMLFTIEGSLNQIWRVQRRRDGVSAFMMYWAILTLVPFLLGAGLAASSYVMSLLAFDQQSWGAGNHLLEHWLPLMIAFTIFLVLYIAVPNAKVRISSGIKGALTATILFSISKWGFGWYLHQYDTYELIYGAFAIIPIFLLWLYIIWTVVLFGAEVAHTSSLVRLSTSYDSIDPFSQSLIWLRKIHQANNNQQMLNLHTLTDADDFRYKITPIEQLEILLQAKILKITGDGNLMLAGNLLELSLRELMDAVPWKLPKALDIPEIKNLAQFKDLARNMERNNQELLAKKVKDIIL